MKLPPDELRILGKRWNCIAKENIQSEKEAYGITCVDEQLIEYDSKHLTPSQMCDTVLHEVIHAIDFTIGTNLTEEQVHGTAAGLFAVLADNPEFCKWLLDRFCNDDKKIQHKS